MENVFNIKYNTKLDRLELPKERLTDKIYNKIRSHKFISVVIFSFIVLSIFNIYLVYSFISILEKI